MPTKAPAKKVAATKKVAAKKAVPAKAAAKKAVAAPAAESNGGGRQISIDMKLANRIAKMRDAGTSFTDIAAELEMTPGKAQLLNMFARVEDADRITGTPAQIAKKVVKERDAGYSWGALCARTGIGEARLRTMYEEETGNSTKGNRIGKGGRYPGDVNPNENGRAAAPAKKVVASKKAAAPAKATSAKKGVAKKAAGKAAGGEENVNAGGHPLVDMPLTALKQRLEGRKIRVRREGNKEEVIEVKKINKKTRDGEVTLIDGKGNTRTILAVQILSASK